MSSLPIAPDESTGEPRCVATCPSATPSTACECCIDCEADRVQTEVGLLCLPRVRELVAISRRKCDGCRHFTTRLDGYEDAPGCERGYHANSTEPGDSCSRWEAKP